MRLKICIIIICLIIFGCKSKEEPVYITRIGELTPGNGIPHLEIYNEDTESEIYELWFPSGTETSTLPFHKTVKIVGEEDNYWFIIPVPPYNEKVLRLRIKNIKSMEIMEPDVIEPTEPDIIEP